MTEKRKITTIFDFPLKELQRKKNRAIDHCHWQHENADAREKFEKFVEECDIIEHTL